MSVLSANRPEVIFNMGATMVTGCRTTPLHPLGSLEDHAYVLEDAGIETLVYDPSVFGGRAAELRDKVPGLKHLLAFGADDVGENYLEVAAQYDAAAAARPAGRADRRVGSHLHGRHDRQAQGRHELVPQLGHDDADPDGRMGMARGPALPDHDARCSHAGAAFIIPTLLRGGSIVVSSGFDPPKLFELIEKYKITATMLVPTMLYMLMDHPAFADRRPVEPADVYYGAAAASPTRLKEAIEKLGPIFFQFFGQSECADDDHRAAQGRARRRQPGTPRVVRPPDAVGASSRCSTTKATRSPRASPARSACAGRS